MILREAQYGLIPYLATEPDTTTLSTQEMGDAVLNALEQVVSMEREHA